MLRNGFAARDARNSHCFYSRVIKKLSVFNLDIFVEFSKILVPSRTEKNRRKKERLLWESDIPRNAKQTPLLLCSTVRARLRARYLAFLPREIALLRKCS